MNCTEWSLACSWIVRRVTKTCEGVFGLPAMRKGAELINMFNIQLQLLVL